jgi:ankyrin repeat protein
MDIIQASMNGDIDAVTAALEKDPASANARDSHIHSTPLHFASHRGYTDIVRSLLDHGADANAREGCSGTTPLHWAAEAGHRDVAAALIDHGASLEAVDDWYQLSPIDWTAVVHHAEKFHADRDATARLLMEHGARSGIFRAIARDDLEELRATRKGARRLSRRLGPALAGMMPLHFAAARGNADIVELLVDRGAAMDTATNRGHSALSLAVVAGHDGVVGVLEKRGMEARLPTLLARGEFDRAAAVVVEDPRVLAKGGACARLLLSFAELGNEAVVDWLLEHGADPTVTDLYLGVDEWLTELSALHLAARGGHSRVIRRLVDGGADVNVRSSRSRITPLHLAAVHGHLETTIALVSVGADPGAVDATHKAAPIGWAAWGEHDPVVEYLKSVMPEVS